MTVELKFTAFKRADFPEYQSWYEDAELNLRLGPMDEAWLEHVLSQTDGVDYSVWREDELVAVVGVLWPTDEHPAYFLTAFALKPDLRSQGLGSQILQQLMQLHPPKDGVVWRAFVDVKNPRAKTFFEQNGWVCPTGEPDENDMIALEYRSAAISD